MDETQLAKLRAFLETTGLHVLEGYEAGMQRGSVASTLLLYSVALYKRDHGAAETIRALRAEADRLAQPD